MSDFMYKVVLVGDTSVGKSSLMRRFADDSFEESYLATIGVDFKFKSLEIEGKSIKLKIWDTAGQERFRTITSAYYKGAQGVMISYDVKVKKTLEDIETFWLGEVQKYGDKDIKIMILGNKFDMLDEEEKKQAHLDLEEFSKKNNIQGFLVSAKTGENVGQAFELLTKECVKVFGSTHKDSSQAQSVIEDIRKKKARFELDNHKTGKKTNKCC